LIVKNMLLHSREGSGERSSVNINTMVEEALNLAYHGARAENSGFSITIVKSLDPDAGAADLYPQEATRVLLNLISNGFYATTKRRHGEANGAYEPIITASTRNLGDSVEIAIRDNGTGIGDEVKAKMFNPFFTTKPAGEGTGLGLSLSHDIIVKQHGGTLEGLDRAGRLYAVHDRPAARRGQRMSALILVVDDEPDVAELFRQQFRKELRASQFGMEFAQSAQEALERVGSAGSERLILILSDVNMPGMSGIELLPRARQVRPDVPVIMITAYGDAETRRKAIEAGAAGLLTKPIDFPELRGEIDRLLIASTGAQ
jgi:CheY-like chemotaxis protein/anti-sigma regulatory factor (Ser/Thr protein kinase)